MGSPDFAVPSLQSLYKVGHDIAAVFTQPDKPKGRGKEFAPTAIKKAALSLGLQVYTPKSIKTEEVITLLREISPEVIVVVAYGKILPAEILSLPIYGCINVHASILPKYRGAAPIHRSVINGDETTGVTTMYMDIGLDTGDMIYKEETQITNSDTVGSVHDRLAQLGAELIVKTMQDVEAGIAPHSKQDDNIATYAPILTKEDEKIIWSKAAHEVFNHIRGMNPFPGTFSLLRGEVLKIWGAEIEPISHQATPGTILAADNKKGLLVACRNDAVWLTEVQPRSGKRMTGDAFVRGYKISQGEVLA